MKFHPRHFYVQKESLQVLVLVLRLSHRHPSLARYLQLRDPCQQFRQQTTQEVQQYRQQTVRECQEIQQDADKYADAVLSRIERDLGEMMRIVTNGRQRLYENPPSNNAPNQNMITPQVSQASTRVSERPERSRKRTR